MDGYGRRNHADARTGELLRVAANTGPLIGHYLASEDARASGVVAIQSTVPHPSRSRHLPVGARRLGALLVEIGQRLRGGRTAEPATHLAVGTPEAAG